jgi:arginyl-tRNA synthetase
MDKKVIDALKVTGLLAHQIEELLERPKDSSLGDFAFPCFALSKTMKKSPIHIAEELAKKIDKNGFDKVEANGPYINFFLDSKKTALELIQRISKEKKKYGHNLSGKGKTFMMEFSQPNTHKAFHVGHIRGTTLGESIARVREANGYKVIRANYSGDTGMHIAKWLWAYTKFHADEEIQNNESWFAKIYVEAIQKLEGNEIGENEVLTINKKLDEGKDAKLQKLWKNTRTKSINAWKEIYSDLDVKFDEHYFESDVEEKGKKISLDLVKKGIAEISDGATIINLKERGLGVWVLLRRDGTVLYSAKDLALAEEKFKKYNMDESLIITSVEQNLHFQQLKRTLELMDFPNNNKYNHIGYESVRLPEGKMSSRTGNNILYADFRDELISAAKEEISKRNEIKTNEANERAHSIAIAAIKYSMLKQDTNKVIIFNKEEAIRFEGDTGPYLLYSLARANSILAKSKINKTFKVHSLQTHERVLLNELMHFPDLVADISKTFNVNGMAHYSYNLAQKFNEFYHACQVIGSKEEEFRLALVSSFIQVMQNALYLLGIPTIEKM